MKRFRRFFGDLGIKKKIILSSYMIVTPIMVLTSALIFARNYRNTISQKTESSWRSFRSLEESVDSYLAELTTLSAYISINSDIARILTSQTPEILNRNSQLWRQSAPMQTLLDMISLNGYVKTIAIYPENGVFPYLRCIDDSAYIQSIEQVRKTEQYSRALSLRGVSFPRRTAKGSTDTYYSSYADKITVCREAFDLSKKTPLGYIVIGADAQKFTELCISSMQDDKEGALVLNAWGEELAMCGKAEAAALEWLHSQEFLSLHYKQKSGKFIMGGLGVLISQKRTNGVITVKFVPQFTLGDIWINVAYTPALLLVGFLVALFPISVFVSNIISKPLKRICDAMALFKNGDFSQQVAVETQDEVGEVAAGFNLMVQDIKKLIDNNYVMALKEKESELAALQAQINPHFLYNTLDSLYFLAQGAQNEEIAEDILALSNLFRLVLGQGKGSTVRDEKELVCQYLQVQKMRFTKRLNYQVDISEDILDAEIPKLIIQPFVENAVVHGFENAASPCLLEVKGWLEDGQIHFSIKDTGIGMSEEQTRAIWQTDDSKRYSGQRIGKYAIKNVMERLELKYGDNFNLNIDSKIGLGTTVFIRIPLKEGTAA
jgi:two-component system sensor histidine kinase YesM